MVFQSLKYVTTGKGHVDEVALVKERSLSSNRVPSLWSTLTPTSHRPGTGVKLKSEIIVHVFA